MNSNEQLAEGEQTAAVRVPSTALTVVERARVALKTIEREAELIALAEASKSIIAITNADGREQVHRARIVLKTRRVDLQKDGKEARQDATNFQKAVIAEETRLVEIIEAEERRLEALQKKWDDAREAERQAKLDAERNRVTAIQNRIAALNDEAVNLTGKSAAEMRTRLSALRTEVPTEAVFQESIQTAVCAHESAVARVSALLVAQEAHEAEQAQLAAERQALERQRIEQEERDRRERERIADEECQAQARRDAETAAAQEQLRKEREENEQRALAQQERIRVATSEIEGIQHQVVIATLGRVGVRAGETRECIVETLAETEAWVIDAEGFGSLRMIAEQAKASAITQIRGLLQQWDDRAELRHQQAEQQRVEAEERERLEAEEQRLAAERAELARQQEEQRKADEAEQLRRAEQARIAALVRPSDIEMIDVLAKHYNAPTGKVIQWLSTLDVEALQREEAA